MALYRVMRRLSRKDEILDVGEMTALEWLAPEQVAVLVEKKAVSRLAAPPLAELPGWSRRALRLEKAGIEDAEQFLECDEEEVAPALRVRPATVKRWKREVHSWLVVPAERGG